MKRIYTVLAALLLTLTTQAQSPELMTYQALLRNGNDMLLTKKPIGMRISLLQGIVGGTTTVYTETHTASTNANGLLTLNIGAGTSDDNFSSIDWSQGPYFIKTETDLSGGTDYSITATSQLLSVPYSLHSKTADALTGMTLYYGDRDGDAYGDKWNVVKSTTPVEGYVLDNTDCDDTDNTINPENVWYIDADGDGYGASSEVSCERPDNGFVLSELSGIGTDDCDDTDNTINPENVWYIDADGDGYGASSVASCEKPDYGFVLSELSGTDDCNDDDSDAYPNQDWYIDADGDGYGSSSEVSCERPVNGFVLSDLSGIGTDDCDDTDNTINPENVWYIDADGDGYGGSSVASCERPSNGFLLSDLSGSGTDDCYDSNSAINPGKTEIYGNDIDDDCDGEFDNLALGQERDGGIVFYIADSPTDLDGDGVPDTGLVCATEDQSSGVQWYNGSYSTIGATATSVGSGATNTATIIAAQGEGTYATSLVRAYEGGGFDDWFLPSRKELNLMYVNLHKEGLGGFTNNNYWSATESNGEMAWIQVFATGYQYHRNKRYKGIVRAVRAF